MGTRKVNWAGDSANPFDAIAVTSGKTPKGKTVKIAAVVTDEIKIAVDTFISKKAELAKVKVEVEQLDGQIIDHVKEQQERLARSGNYAKSFDVQGVTGNLTYTTSDKFSTPKEPEVQVQLKNLLGGRFSDLFVMKRNITLKTAVQSDTKFLQKFAKALADAGINLGETFDVTDVLEAKEDLDKNQYDLTPREHEVFKTLVKQTKPSLR
jgi:hypothetical protein